MRLASDRYNVLRRESASTRGLIASTLAATRAFRPGSSTSAAWPTAMRLRSLSATCATTCSSDGSPSSSSGSPPGATVAPTATRIDITTPLVGAFTVTRLPWPAPIRPAACRARSYSVRASFSRASASWRSDSRPTPFSTISTLRRGKLSGRGKARGRQIQRARAAEASALSMMRTGAPALTTSPARTSCGDHAPGHRGANGRLRLRTEGRRDPAARARRRIWVRRPLLSSGIVSAPPPLLRRWSRATENGSMREGGRRLAS